MNEPPLWEIEAEEAYRLLWLRSFDPPIAVRITRKDRVYSLTAVALSQQRSAGFPRSITEQVFRHLSPGKWDQSVQLIDQSQFCSLPTLDILNRISSVDGATWILEGQRDGSYHVVTRSSPAAEGELSAFRAALIHLLQISKLELPQFISEPERSG